MPAPPRRPMSEFDPTKPCWVHDSLNDVMFEWEPVDLVRYRRLAHDHGDGRHVNWDGLLLDGWEPWPEVELPRPPSAEAQSDAPQKARRKPRSKRSPPE
jgi:hypothetical protein